MCLAQLVSQIGHPLFTNLFKRLLLSLRLCTESIARVFPGSENGRLKCSAAVCVSSVRLNISPSHSRNLGRHISTASVVYSLMAQSTARRFSLSLISHLRLTSHNLLYRNARHRKGPSIYYVRKILGFFDPLPPLSTFGTDL